MLKYLVLLFSLTCAFAIHAATPDLPELIIKLADIPEGDCQQINWWRLPHAALPVAVCHLPSAVDQETTPSLDVSALRAQTLALRERLVNPDLAQAIFTMQTHLDAIPHRSLHPVWRVFINLGTFGCAPAIEHNETSTRYRDPCNQNGYDLNGRPLAPGYPALSIPPYVIEESRLILGRQPTTLPQQETLPPVVWEDITPETAVEQLVRAARWGRLARVSEILDRGTDLEAIAKNGNTALLTAIQARQTETVALLLSRGANPKVSYASGLTALELVRIVESVEIETLLTQAMAKPSATVTPSR